MSTSLFALSNSLNKFKCVVVYRLGPKLGFIRPRSLMLNSVIQTVEKVFFPTSRTDSKFSFRHTGSLV